MIGLLKNCCCRPVVDLGCEAILWQASSELHGCEVPNKTLVNAASSVPTLEEFQAWYASAVDALGFDPTNFTELLDMVAQQFSSVDHAGRHLFSAGSNTRNMGGNRVNLEGEFSYWADYGGGYEKHTYSFSASIFTEFFSGALIQINFSDSFGNTLEIRPNWDNGDLETSGTRSADWLAYMNGTIEGPWLLVSDGPETNVISYYLDAVRAMMGGWYDWLLEEYLIPETSINPVSNDETDYGWSYSSRYSREEAPFQDRTGEVSIRVSVGVVDYLQHAYHALEKLNQADPNYPTVSLPSFSSGVGGFFVDQNYPALSRRYMVWSKYELGGYWSFFANRPGWFGGSGPIIGDIAVYAQNYFILAVWDIVLNAYAGCYNYGSHFTASKSLFQIPDSGIGTQNVMITHGQQPGTYWTNWVWQDILPNDCSYNFLPPGRHVIEPDSLIYEFGLMRVIRRYAMWSNGPGCGIAFDGITDEHGNDISQTLWDEQFNEICQNFSAP